MRWFRIRKADIPKQERDTFERFGVSVIGSALARLPKKRWVSESGKSSLFGLFANARAKMLIYLIENGFVKAALPAV